MYFSRVSHHTTFNRGAWCHPYSVVGTKDPKITFCKNSFVRTVELLDVLIIVECAVTQNHDWDSKEHVKNLLGHHQHVVCLRFEVLRG